jgi:hypothetical protein
VDWLDVLAMALGVVIAGGLAVLVSPLAAQNDPDMVWEGRVAVGFAALLYVGPLWLGQAATTLGAAVTAGGIWPGWLWGWLVVAPLLGATPPAAALARRVTHGVAGGSSRTDVNRSGAAVQQASNFAWADTAAEPGWELRRTPPLPVTWPPTPDGSAVWFCYAERSVTPETIEVAGPQRADRGPSTRDAASSSGGAALGRRRVPQDLLQPFQRIPRARVQSQLRIRFSWFGSH